MIHKLPISKKSRALTCSGFLLCQGIPIFYGTIASFPCNPVSMLLRMYT